MIAQSLGLMKYISALLPVGAALRSESTPGGFVTENPMKARRTRRGVFTCCLMLGLTLPPCISMAQNAQMPLAPTTHQSVYEFVPAQPGQTLNEIASYLIPDESVTLEQVIWALFIKNPLQFTENNLNSLIPQPRLTVPTLEEIRAIDRLQAQSAVARHNESWVNRAPVGVASFTERPKDATRPPEQLTLRLLDRPLTIGGEIEAELRHRQDLSLGRRDDDDTRISLGLQLEFLYRLTPNTSIYLEIDPSYQKYLYAEDGDTDSRSRIELGELWLYMEKFGNQRVSLQVGRQYFGEEREWWWAENLDAVRVHYKDEAFNTQIAIGMNPTRILTEHDGPAPEYEDIIWLLANASWEWTRRNYLEVFFLSRFDHSSTLTEGDIIAEALEDEEDAVINWLGLRSRGRTGRGDLGRLHYWVDSGVVYGKETRYDFDGIDNDQSLVDERLEYTISGWGFDIGATWESSLRYSPRLTLAYAMGSGDRNPDDDVDRAYRQSGMHSNNDRFRGVNSFRYYGELFRPELSNLYIGTLALGFPLLDDSSIELVYHRYTQTHATDELRNARLRSDPTGDHDDIGEEFNVIIGLEEWKQFELELVAAQFHSGEAFGPLSDRTASIITLEAQYSF